jgi:transcriptional regulator with XRE-family HTH domain
MVRALRVSAGLKQRQVAAGIGIKDSTYGNVECSPHRVIGIDRVRALARFFELPESQAAVLVAAWEATPLSEFGERHKAAWERRNRMRYKAKHHDRVFASLVEVLGILIPALPEGQVCSCELDGELCTVCAALDNLGLAPFESQERTMTMLARLADKIHRREDLAAADAPPA